MKFWKIKEKYRAVTGTRKIFLEGVFVLPVFIFFICAAFVRPLLWGVGSVQWDAVNVHLLNLYFSSNLLSAGELPLWTPHIFWGYPQIADPQVAIFYPLNFIFSYFGEFTGGDLLFITIFHYVLAGFFMWLLVRYLTGKFWPAFFAGSAFMFSGFMVGHASHIGMLSSAAWMPLIFLLLIIALRKLDIKTAILAGFVTGIMILAGHFQTALFIVSFVAAYVIFDFFRDKFKNKNLELKKLLILGVIGVVAFLTAAVQIIPTYELQMQTYRSKLPIELAQQESLNPYTLWNFINPIHQNILRHSYIGPHDITQNYVYIGILTIILAVAGIIFSKRTKLKVFLVSMASIALLFSFGGYFPYVQEFFWKYVPYFDKIRAPANAMLIVHFSLIIIAAAFLSELSEKLKFKKTKTLTAGIALFVLFELSAFATVSVFLHSRSDPVSVFPAVDELQLEKELKEEIGKTNDPACPLVPCNGRRGRMLWIHREPNRGNVPQVSGMYSADGYNPLTFQRHREIYKYIGESEGIMNMANVKYTICDRLEDGKPVSVPHPDAQNSSEELCENEDAFPYAYFSPAYEVNTETEDMEFLKDFPFEEKILLEREPPADLFPELFLATGVDKNVVDVVKREPGEIVLKVSTEQPGLVLVAENYYPGWTATVNGEPAEIMRGNYLFQAVPVKAGESEVRLEYKNNYLKYGALMSLLGLLLFFTAVVKIFFLKNKRK